MPCPESRREYNSARATLRVLPEVRAYDPGKENRRDGDGDARRSGFSSALWLTRCRILEFRSPSWPIRPLHKQSFTGESTLNTVDSSTVLEQENLELACTDRGSKSTSTGIDAIGPCSTQGTGSSQSMDCCQLLHLGAPKSDVRECLIREDWSLLDQNLTRA